MVLVGCTHEGHKVWDKQAYMVSKEANILINSILLEYRSLLAHAYASLVLQAIGETASVSECEQIWLHLCMYVHINVR